MLVKFAAFPAKGEGSRGPACSSAAHCGRFARGAGAVPAARERMMLEFPNDTEATAEEKLVARVRAGDRSAANTLFARHLRPCYQAAYRVLRNREEAEDAVQDGLLLAFRHFSSYQGRAPFRSWVRRIVVNAAFSRLRACASRSAVSLDELPAAALGRAAAAACDPYEQALRGEARRQVLGQLPGLRPAEGKREGAMPEGFGPQAGAGRLACLILVLYYFYGYRTGEIAGRLGLPEGTVRARMFRARRLVRSRLGEVAWLTPACGGRHRVSSTRISGAAVGSLQTGPPA
jgi:RNA polymerase sigma-70 factor, ECF subfamily